MGSKSHRSDFEKHFLKFRDFAFCIRPGQSQNAGHLTQQISRDQNGHENTTFMIFVGKIRAQSIFLVATSGPLFLQSGICHALFSLSAWNRPGFSSWNLLWRFMWSFAVLLLKGWRAPITQSTITKVTLSARKLITPVTLRKASLDNCRALQLGFFLCGAP